QRSDRVAVPISRIIPSIRKKCGEDTDASGDASGNDRAGNLSSNRIRAKIAFARDAKNILESGPCAADTALDRAHGAAADFRSLLVGEAGSADQNDRLALVLGQKLERLAEVVQIGRAILGGVNRQASGDGAIAIFYLAATLAHLRVELVAKNGEK